MIYPVSFRSEIKPQNNNSEKKVLPNPKVSSVGGSLGGVALGAAVHHLGMAPFVLPLSKAMINSSNLPKEQGDACRTAIKQMLNDSGLKDKGVRIKFLHPIKRTAKSSVKSEEKFLRTFFENNSINSTREGYNAFFYRKDLKLPKITLSEYLKFAESGDFQLLKQKMKETGVLVKGNSVILSKEKFPTAGFHELGHAMNWNFSALGRTLQKCNSVSMFAPILLGVYGALSKESKPKYDGQELNGKQKANNFLRNNAGKLAFLASVPMLLEEGMATAKGNSFAKKLLSPEVAKKVFKTNAFAYGTYIMTATFAALGARAAVKAKDNAINKKETKAKLKQQVELAKTD